MNTPSGLIIIVHSSLRQVTKEEAVAALPAQYQGLPCKWALLHDDIDLESAVHVHWESFKARQDEWYHQDLKPLIDDHPGYKILYFGLTHIPLAMHLGYLLGDIYQVEPYLLHYQSKVWSWPKSQGEEHKQLDWKLEGLPKEAFSSKGAVILRYGVYAPITPEITEEVVENAVRNINIELNSALEDSFESAAQLLDAAYQFGHALATLNSKFPKIEEIHLFAAVPVGLAFLMGQMVGANRHANVLIYHYKRKEIPNYRLSFVLQEEPSLSLPIEEEGKAVAQASRKMVKRELEGVKHFLKTLKTHAAHWLPESFEKEVPLDYRAAYWSNFVALANTNLPNDEVMLEAHPHDSEEFYLNGNWYFSDELLSTLAEKFGDDDKLLSAMRLFLFHEALHFKSHGMSSGNARGLGRYPKVVETVDYQADVYALIHEYCFRTANKKYFDPKPFFTEAIGLMLETMWAFDAGSRPNTMQMRRLNRYLIWYWQLLRIEHQSCQSLEDILAILAIMPVLEIKGLRANLDDDGRYFVNLSNYALKDLGIAVIHKNRMRRYGSEGDGLELGTLVKAFKQRDALHIKSVLHNLLTALI